MNRGDGSISRSEEVSLSSDRSSSGHHVGSIVGINAVLADRAAAGEGSGGHLADEGSVGVAEVLAAALADTGCGGNAEDAVAGRHRFVILLRSNEEFVHGLAKDVGFSVCVDMAALDAADVLESSGREHIDRGVRFGAFRGLGRGNVDDAGA